MNQRFLNPRFSKKAVFLKMFFFHAKIKLVYWYYGEGKVRLMSTRSILTNVNLNKKDEIRQFLYAAEKSEKQAPVEVTLSRPLHIATDAQVDAFLLSLKNEKR